MRREAQTGEEFLLALAVLARGVEVVFQLMSHLVTGHLVRDE